jgi:hypothetical protein
MEIQTPKRKITPKRRPIAKFKVVKIIRDQEKINEYCRLLNEQVDIMEQCAPYKSLVSSSRALVRRFKEPLHDILSGETETPEIDTKFGMLKYHLDKPCPNSSIPVTSEALRRLDLDETMQKLYNEIEITVKKVQKVEVTTKLFLTSDIIMQAKCDIVELHRNGFDKEYKSYKTDDMEKYYSTKMGELAWHVYVVCQFKDESDSYNKAYNEFKAVFKKMATDPATQQRSYTYKELKAQYIPWERFSQSSSYNNLVRSTISEIAASQDSNLLELFDKNIIDVTYEVKDKVKDRWLRYYVDDVEYTQDARFEL